MSNIFLRISDIISANLNDLLDKVEDPERMILQVIREMENNLLEARERVIDAIASEKRLAKELETSRSHIEEWSKKAETALRDGNDDLARAALTRKAEFQRSTKSLERAWEAAARTSTGLKAQLTALEDKLEEAKRKKSSLIARQRAAEARGQMGVIADHFDRGLNAERKFSRMEDKIDDLEARVEAMNEIYQPTSRIDDEFRDLEIEISVEQDLKAMRERIKEGK